MKIMLIILALFICSLVIIAAPAPALLIFTFITGWVPAGLRLLYHAPFSAGDVTAFAIGCAVFVIGAHAFLRTLRPWPFRWTVTLIGIFAFVLLAIMSFVGVAHQIGWMMLSSEPLLENRSTFFRERMDLQNTAKYISEYAETNTAAILFDRRLPDTHDKKRPWEKFHLMLVEQTNKHCTVLWHRDARIHHRIGAVTVTPDGELRLQSADYIQRFVGKANAYAMEAD